MYCVNCGNKVDENADICLKCGVFLKKDNQRNSTASPKIGKGIASLVLGILAIYFCLAGFAAFDGLEYSLLGYDGTQRIAYAVGFILIQTVFSVPGFCLAVAERMDNENGFNTAGFWLGIVSFICIGIQFIFVLIY
ncbi:MAG: zinc ribbon domain-containing protein [Bacilli bacterium]|jgi:predicted nucleic acid-binding Zn ribbon protein|nr:zinc ribbon domain-containing protein [Bacilli bacterium]